MSAPDRKLGLIDRAGNDPPKRVFHPLRLETKRARSRLVTHPSIAVYHVKTIGPTRVSTFSQVVKAIDERGKPDAKFHNAQLPHLAALVETLRTRKYHVVI